MKRLVWFVGGAVAGIAGASAAKKKVKAATADMQAARVVRRVTERVRDAVAEGRRAMRSKEAELSARRDGRLETLADDLDAGDLVIVDGKPIEPGQVIVVRQVDDRHARGSRRHTRP